MPMNEQYIFDILLDYTLSGRSVNNTKSFVLHPDDAGALHKQHKVAPRKLGGKPTIVAGDDSLLMLFGVKVILDFSVKRGTIIKIDTDGVHEIASFPHGFKSYEYHEADSSYDDDVEQELAERHTGTRKIRLD